MADYFSLTLECIDYVQDKVHGGHSTSLQLNGSQCEYLADEVLLKLKSYILQVKDSQSNLNLVHDIQSKVLPHLHAAAMRAKILVECCCCENSSWNVEAMKLASITEVVIAISLDLHQWKFLLDIAIVAIVGSCPEALIELLKTGEEDYQRLWRKLHSQDGNELRSAALQDQKHLLLKIAEVRKKHDLGEEVQADDFTRAMYLEARVKQAEEDLQNTKELQNFTIIKDLGQGAAGMVLEASWLGHRCALKILNVIDKTESTVLNRLQHPNIVSLFHYWEVQTAFKSYIVMELMPTDLWRFIKVKRQQASAPSQQGAKCIEVTMPFLLPVAIDIMLQVAEGMRYLHVNRKVTHRDLKTSNILVKPVSESTSIELHNQGYLEVKLADFGLAKTYLNSSISGILTPNAGTSVYGAPEIFGKEEVQRRTNFPPKADVWSFGMTCSEILTGEVPFTDEPRKDLHKRISKDGLRPVLPHECPEYLKFCIRSCWELQPERRPSFSDICRLLRHAKFLSLGLMDFEINSCFFAYASRAGIFSTLRNASTQPSVISRLAQSVLEMIGFGGVHQKSIQPTLGESRNATEADFDGPELTSTTKQEGPDCQFDAPPRTPDIPRPHVSHEFRLKSYGGTCGGCGQGLGSYDSPLTCMDKNWHQRCFCCKLCSKPISVSSARNRGLHHGCYKELDKQRQEATRIASEFEIEAFRLAGTKPESSHFQLDGPERISDKEQGAPRVSTDLKYSDDLVAVKTVDKGYSDSKFDSPPRTLGKEGQRPLGTISKYSTDDENSARMKQESSHSGPPGAPFLKEKLERAPRFAPGFKFDGSGLAGTGEQGLEFNSGDLLPEKTMKEGVDFEFDPPPGTPTKEGQGPPDTTFELNNDKFEPGRNRQEGLNFQFESSPRTLARRVPQVQLNSRSRLPTHMVSPCTLRHQVAPSNIGFVPTPPKPLKPLTIEPPNPQSRPQS